MARRQLILTAMVALLGACGTDAAEEATGESREESAENGRAPESRQAVIRIEGMPDTMTLRRFEAPEDFALPFRTWLPEDMRAQPDAGRDAVRFVADFGTSLSRDGYLNLFVFEPETTERDAIALARAIKTSRGVPVSQGLEPVEADAPDILPWAVHEEPYAYQDNGRWFVGRLAIGRHADRFFLIVTHYPQEMGDGMAPRMGRILEDWRWADGSPIGG